MIESPWLTLEEAAAYMRSRNGSTRNIRRLVAQGRLHAGGTRRKLLVHQDHLDLQIRLGFPELGVQGAVQPKSRTAPPEYLTLPERYKKEKKPGL